MASHYHYGEVKKAAPPRSTERAREPFFLFIAPPPAIVCDGGGGGGGGGEQNGLFTHTRFVNKSKNGPVAIGPYGGGGGM